MLLYTNRPTESSYTTLWNSIKWRVSTTTLLSSRVDTRLEKRRREKESDCVREMKNVCKRSLCMKRKRRKVLKIPIHAKSTCFFDEWLVFCWIHISRIKYIFFFNTARTIIDINLARFEGSWWEYENMRMKFYNLWLLLHMCTRKTPCFCLV